MRKLVRNSLAGVAAVTAVLAIAPAQAYVMSGAMLNMTNFQILGSNGVILNQATDFVSLTFTGTADQDVALTGFAPLSNTATNPPTNPINFAPICLGGGCNPILPNDSLPKLTAPPATGNYSAADQYESGAPIAGISGFGSPANVGQGSYIGLDTGTVTASANANNNLNSSFIFALTQSTGITFDFLLDAFLQVAVSSDELFPGFATAAVAMSFTITDLTTGATVFSYSPNIFGDGVNTLSLNAPLPINVEIIRNTGGPVAFSATTPTLNSGTLYQASFRMNTDVDAGRLAAVPEPAMLSLIGLGLLAAGLGARRRMTAA
jgi:hypothetical protein